MNFPIDQRSNQLQKNVARLGDIPYWQAPPMQFSVTQNVPLSLGTYPMAELPFVEMGNAKNLNESTLIEFYDMTFSCDIPEQDYIDAQQLAGGNTDIPNFNMFFQSERKSPTLQDPILLNKYFKGQRYILVLEPKQTPNKLFSYFRGTLQQTAALAGRSSVNMTFEFYAQQITDDDFIQEFKRGYPSTDAKLGGSF